MYRQRKSKLTPEAGARARITRGQSRTHRCHNHQASIQCRRALYIHTYIHTCRIYSTAHGAWMHARSSAPGGSPVGKPLLCGRRGARKTIPLRKVDRTICWRHCRRATFPANAPSFIPADGLISCRLRHRRKTMCNGVRTVT